MDLQELQRLVRCFKQDADRRYDRVSKLGQFWNGYSLACEDVLRLLTDDVYYSKVLSYVKGDQK